jgi:geranylgeranyl reductase family protein
MKWQVTPQYDTDVLIVGGGPAGASCAYHLTAQGLRVLILDYQPFPRDKVCGDFVGPVALKELMNMGIHQYETYQKTFAVTQAALYLDGQPMITKTIPLVEGIPDHGRVIPRITLDDWILKAALNKGATIAEGARLQDYTIFTNGVLATYKKGRDTHSIFAKLIVGADGSSSTVARILTGNKPPAEDRILAVRAYYKNVQCEPGQAELYFTSKSFPGYYWFFPTGPNTANIGVGMVQENFPHQDINLKQLLLELVENDPTLKAKVGKGEPEDKVAGWPLATYNTAHPKIADRLVLVGDAAGLINALNGEGIQYAMLSGRWAAETITTCFQQQQFDTAALTPYLDRILSELSFDMSLSNTVIQFIRNRNLNPFWLKLLDIIVQKARKDNDYADIAGGILAGLKPATEAVSVSFIGKSIGQGVQTLYRDAVREVSRGPVNITRLALSGILFGVQTAGDIMQRPEDYISWGKGIMNHSASLVHNVWREKFSNHG